MKTIDIAQILSPDLKSRMRAQDLKLYVKNSGADAVEFDFGNVKFATRSFIDEFYNLFLKANSDKSISVEITNVPQDIKTMLDSVSHTQIKAKVIPTNISEVTFKDVDAFLNYMNTAKM